MARGPITNKTAALERLIKSALLAKMPDNPRSTGVDAGYELSMMKAELSKLRKQLILLRQDVEAKGADGDAS